jgi:hypothetical protein
MQPDQCVKTMPQVKALGKWQMRDAGLQGGVVPLQRLSRYLSTSPPQSHPCAKLTVRCKTF